MTKNTKLDEATVIEIFKKIFNDKNRDISIAKELGVTTYIVWGIKTGKTWKDVREKLVRAGVIVIPSKIEVEDDADEDEDEDIDSDEFVGIFNKNEPDIEYVDDEDVTITTEVR